MQAARVAVSIFILTTAFASAYHSSEKLRRDGIVNLYPFPRVGRSSHNSWQVPVQRRQLDHQPIQRRQLYAFPRVGRSDLSFLHASLDGDTLDLLLSANPKMWFDPRLGRPRNRNGLKSEQSDPEQLENSSEERIDEKL